MDPDSVIKIIDYLSESLSPSKQKLWELALQQVAVNTKINIIFCVISLAVAVAITIKTYGYIKERNMEKRGDWMDYFPLIVLAIIIVFLPSLVLLIESINYAYNPEWQALKIVIGLGRNILQ